MRTFTKQVAARFTNDFSFEDASFESERRAVVRHLREFVARQYGPRCGEFESGCPICEMWARHDSVRDYVCD